MNQTCTLLHSDPNRRAERITQELKTVAELAPVQRRVVRAGEVLFGPGLPLQFVHLVSVGVFKSTSCSVDGREMVVGFHARGAWLGFDAVAEGHHQCETLALDTSEVMSVPYEALLAACARHPELMKLVHQSMSREQARDRDALLAMTTLDAAARVAGFLFTWAESMAESGLRNDQVMLRVTRAEIGSYLGLKLETVSRAFSRLAQDRLIGFEATGRRTINIPRVQALAAFVHGAGASAMSAAVH